MPAGSRSRDCLLGVLPTSSYGAQYPHCQTTGTPGDGLGVAKLSQLKQSARKWRILQAGRYGFRSNVFSENMQGKMNQQLFNLRRHHMLNKRLMLLVLFSLLCTPLVFGQATSGIIAGTVTDQQGAVVPGAAVTIKNLDTDFQRQVSTDSNGYYRVAALPVGRYVVRAERAGFKVDVSNVTPTVAEEAVVNFKMEVGSVSEQVTVASTGTEVETTNATMGGLVDEKKIRDLPLNGRSFDQLIYLQPGVTVATSAGASPNQGRGTKFSVGGARLTSNLFMLDGTDMIDSTPNICPPAPPGVKSIKEFKVITHNAPAEYGRSMGGII